MPPRGEFLPTLQVRRGKQGALRQGLGAPQANPHLAHISLQVLTDKEGGMMAKYYLLEAGLIDFSCRGG